MVPTSAGTGCGDEQLTKNGLEIGEGLPRWAGGAACGGTSLHSASCDQSHDSRKRMVQTECVTALHAGGRRTRRAGNGRASGQLLGGEHFAGGRDAGRARWAGAARGPRAIWAARIFAVHTFSHMCHTKRNCFRLSMHHGDLWG